MIGKTHEECKKFFLQIRNHFDYLFEQHGFSVVHESGNGEHCLFVVQSGNCQIEFLYDRGIVEVSVGTPQHKYYIFWVINFIKDKDRLTLEEVDQTMELFWSGRIEEGLSAISKVLKPVCGEIVELFQEETFRKKRNALERFYHAIGELPSKGDST